MAKFTLADPKGKPLDRKEVDNLLSGPNILRLGVLDERDGSPMVHPVWFHYENEMFFVAADTGGLKARSVQKNPNVYFLVDTAEGPPRGVRGKGVARVRDDHSYATEVTRKCTLKYLGTSESETAKKIIEMGRDSSVIEIIPKYIATWKF
ncbi:pyridoxamine 5'-phosphate oxidase family protein [Nitrososphaera sp.]|uniref:pyridoxamine 5'-phosphate oxidase family protein n=2 Tax=Nitrososphaera sp. TaxID=1971748 RepID=UPI0018194997|nr:pyridoxamine 5'-phosphate oxidase family protein [Nitrososphaera sp.]NWG37183.1 pyridoxamine 5'-phosphate oxidase family protein [Nitrososphaera sp.]